ncbi:MAG: thioredoxin family protein [Anaerolineae bacterium]|nr:thioredoxin family protein [Anaerolineae bacterium]
MALLSARDQEHLRREFQKLTQPVKLVVFTQERECEYCRETRQIVDEVASLNDKIRVEVRDFVADAAVAEELGVDKIPAIALLADGLTPRDYGIRYYGIPSGYEFSSLIEDILMVSQGESGLSAATKAKLAALDKPLHLQVFVTPTCPYCPRAVRLAHQMAVESPLVRADMVEAIEFPHLAHKYSVMGVPRTVINDTVHLEGAAPEPMLMQKVLEAVR